MGTTHGLVWNIAAISQFSVIQRMELQRNMQYKRNKLTQTALQIFNPLNITHFQLYRNIFVQINVNVLQTKCLSNGKLFQLSEVEIIFKMKILRYHDPSFV